MEDEEKKEKLHFLILGIRIVVSLTLALLGFLLFNEGSYELWVNLIFMGTAYLIISYDLYIEMVEEMKEGHIFNEATLMIVASLGAFALRFFGKEHNEFLEAYLVILLFQVGEVFQDLAEDKSRKAILKSIDLREELASVSSGEEIIRRKPEEVHVGDIVIVSPEISKQTLSMYFNPLEMSKALERNKDMFFKLNGKMQEGMIAAIPSFNAEKISYLSKGDIPMPKDIYASSSFNEYGDIKVTREGNIMFGGIDKNNPISIDKAVIEDEFIKELNNFAKTVKDKGGECYFRFSPMNASSISYKDDLRTFYDYLDEKISFGILGDPYKAIMEKEWFYDTNFHLNSPGAKMWTKNLINDIKVTLNITSPTPIKDEDKPPLSSPDDSKDGDNSFLDCFEYEEKENEVVLTKLIKESEDIIVPYKYNGKIITSFNDDVFQGKKGIREITIQDNIRLLYDYSFSGSGVNKIVISNDRPNSIGVGDHLLNGANAYIYVDKDNLNTYKPSYNWAKYAPYIRAK